MRGFSEKDSALQWVGDHLERAGVHGDDKPRAAAQLLPLIEWQLETKVESGALVAKNFSEMVFDFLGVDEGTNFGKSNAKQAFHNQISKWMYK
jgi:hypothetical protein